MTKRERFNQSEPDIILNQRVRAAHHHDRWLEPPALGLQSRPGPAAESLAAEPPQH